MLFGNRFIADVLEYSGALIQYDWHPYTKKKFGHKQV